jgi:hypothetical protein
MLSLQEKALTIEQFSELMNYVIKHHRFGVPRGKFIKYVRPHFDLRDQRVFSITFDNMGKTFDSRDNDKSMYDNIMKWLKEGEK